MIYVLDLDGTLIDSTARHGALLKALLDNSKIEYPINLEDDYLTHKRNGYSTKHFLQEKLLLNEKQSNEISSQWINHIEDEVWVAKDKLYDDAIQFLESIYSKNMVVYLSSRLREDILLQELDGLKIDHYASGTFVSNPSEGVYGKEKHLKTLKSTHNEQIIMIGDTEIDYHAAINANCDFFVLNRGFRNKQFWDVQGILSHPSLPIKGDSRIQ